MVTAAAKATRSAWSRRTGKRETALCLLLFWIAVSAKIFFWTYDVAILTALGTLYTSMTTMVFLYVGSVFGMDYYAKQVIPATGAPR